MTTLGKHNRTLVGHGGDVRVKSRCVERSEIVISALTNLIPCQKVCQYQTVYNSHLRLTSDQIGQSSLILVCVLRNAPWLSS
jgi:hypothetical protein